MPNNIIAPTLFITQIIAHLALLSMVFYAETWQWGIVLIVYFFNGCIGMTSGYHKLLSHKSWNPPRWLEIFVTLCATIGLTGPAIGWIANHRKHHAFSDSDKDPQSPIVNGWWRTQYLSMFFPIQPKYAVHLLRDKFYVFQNTYYFHINIAWACIAMLLFRDWYAIVYAWLAPAAVLWSLGSLIVSSSHRQRVARNDWWLALLVWGEGWHSNHHDNPGNWKFHTRLDPSAWFIGLCKLLRIG